MTVNPITIVALVIAILAFAIAIWALFESQKTRRLRSKFGPEYDRAVQRERDPARAEALLEQREKRVSKYKIHPLSPRETERFESEWQMVQEHFVDSPRNAVGEAEHLIDEAMKTRGYPISDFEAQAADLSVDYPMVVEHYRAAHAIDIRQNRAPLNTEELRKAMRHYRVLFEQVIGARSIHHHSGGPLRHGE
jgi:hypothetical protein